MCWPFVSEAQQKSNSTERKLVDHEGRKRAIDEREAAIDRVNHFAEALGKPKADLITEWRQYGS